jgi:hypothetical protein
MRGKAVPVHAMKTYRNSRRTVPLILTLSTRWSRVVNFTPRPSYLREGIPVSTEHEDGWALEHVRTICRRRKSLALAGNQAIFDYSTVLNCWMQRGETQYGGRF